LTYAGDDTMQVNAQRITPFLWFDRQAEEAARFYTSVFPDSRITTVTHYGPEGAIATGLSEDTVMTIAFELGGQQFVALNGGPRFRFSEAISFIVNCTSQEEIDYYWDRLSEGGDPTAQQCGWLKDRYGLSWQIVPANLGDLLSGPDPGAPTRVMNALLQMKKLDIAALEQAAAGGDSDRELATTRVIDAPRERVFEAIRDPQRLARWWGPAGFTNTFEEFDFRPGGSWRLTMHGPDGRNYPNVSEFVEIVEPERVAIRHISQPHFDLTVTLTDRGGATEVGWRQRFESAAVCEGVRAICVPANEQNLDRLTTELARMP
jgi:predicted 3-demethylubiquinone-9 3-methyltransferase (glyoxalase superfamily)/uncharacterized protein YndB with AHSA1/START domain